MNTKRYTEVRVAIIKALETGNYYHETRKQEATEKNLLQAEVVTAEFVASLIRNCPGRNATRSEHHLRASIDVWELKTKGPCVTDEDSSKEKPIELIEWYIKFYFITENTWFISVHPASPPTDQRSALCEEKKI